MALNENVNINCILNKLSKELETLSENEYYIESLSLLDKLDLNEHDKKTVDSLKVLIASYLYSVQDFREDWEAYTRTFDMAVEKDINSLSDKYNTLSSKYNQLLGAYKNLSNKNKLLDVQIDILKKTIDTLEENTKLIAGINGARKRLVNNPSSVAFKQRIDNEELQRVYVENNYKITKEMLEYFNSKEKITYDGLRKRLQSLGVWKGLNR